MLDHKRKEKYLGVGLIALGIALESVELVPRSWPAWLGWTQFGLGVVVAGIGVALYFRSKGLPMWFAIPVAALPLYGPALALLVRSAGERAQNEALEAAKPAPHADARVRYWTGVALGASWLLELLSMFAMSRAGEQFLGQEFSQGLCIPLMLAAMVACAIFLGLYAWARGQNPACGFLAIVPVFGPPVGLLDLALGMKLSARAAPERRVAMEKAREWSFVLFFFGLFISISPALDGIGFGISVFGLFLYLGYIGAAFIGNAAMIPALLAGLVAACSTAGTMMMKNPSWGGLIRKSQEGATKGNLGQIRAALSIYYGDKDGKYPLTLESLAADTKHFPSLPPAKPAYFHKDSSAVRLAKTPDDAGGWLYDGAGTLLVNCTHTDTKGKEWKNY